jgi:outer membrane protein assembly factor BamB
MNHNQPDKAGGQMKIRRRNLIIALALVIAVPFLSSLPATAENTQFDIIGRWSTDNETLRPITLVEDRLYLAGESTIEAWDTQNGRRLWKQPLEKGADFRPRLAGDLILANSKSYMIAFDRETGQKRWSYQPNAPLGTPYYHNGRVFLGVGHLLSALDVTTGKVQWTMSSDQAKGIWYAPTVYANSVLAGLGDGYLYSLDIETGKLNWKVNRAKKWQYLRQLFTSGDTLVAGGYKDNLFGIDAATGKHKWYWYSGNFINSHLVYDGVAYLWSPTGWVYSLNARSGKRNWRTKSDYFPRKSGKKTPWAPVMAEIVADTKGIYVLDMKSVVHVLDHINGKEIAAIQFKERLRPFVVLEPGTRRMFLGNTKGEILYVENKYIP